MLKLRRNLEYTLTLFMRQTINFLTNPCQCLTHTMRRYTVLSTLWLRHRHDASTAPGEGEDCVEKKEVCWPGQRYSGIKRGGNN